MAARGRVRTTRGEPALCTPVLLACGLLLSVGLVVGPDFVAPQPSIAEAWHEATDEVTTEEPEYGYPYFAFLLVNTTEPKYTQTYAQAVRERLTKIAEARITVDNSMLGPTDQRPVYLSFERARARAHCVEIPRDGAALQRDHGNREAVQQLGCPAT